MVWKNGPGHLAVFCLFLAGSLIWTDGGGSIFLRYFNFSLPIFPTPICHLRIRHFGSMLVPSGLFRVPRALQWQVVNVFQYRHLRIMCCSFAHHAFYLRRRLLSAAATPAVVHVKSIKKWAKIYRLLPLIENACAVTGHRRQIMAFARGSTWRRCRTWRACRWRPRRKAAKPGFSNGFKSF